MVKHQQFWYRGHLLNSIVHAHRTNISGLWHRRKQFLYLNGRAWPICSFASMGSVIAFYKFVIVLVALILISLSKDWLWQWWNHFQKLIMDIACISNGQYKGMVCLSGYFAFWCVSFRFRLATEALWQKHIQWNGRLKN